MMKFSKESLISAKTEMKAGACLTKDSIQLKLLSPQDCSTEYVNWLNDPVVNRYLETRWETQDIEKVKQFVQAQWDSEDVFLFAIMLHEQQKHIGNIKLGPINFNHQCADISFFIGDVASWGKQYATTAIQLVCNFGFKHHLNRLEAGLYAENTGSLKALLNVGFIQEGQLKSRLIQGQDRQDHFLLGLLAKDFQASN